MRTPILALTILLGLFAWSAVPDGVVAASSTTVVVDDAAQQQPPTDIDVDIGQEGGAWYTSPMWIAIGAIALVVIILLIVMAGRGGGTTIVRD